MQTLIRQPGAQLFEWLEQGGYIYICADAHAWPQTSTPLFAIAITEHGNLDNTDVNACLDMLVAEYRYQRGVY